MLLSFSAFYAPLQKTAKIEVYAPAHHPPPLLRGFRVHILICRGSGLPPFFLLSPANSYDAPLAKRLLAGAVHSYQIHSRIVRLYAAYWILRLISWIHSVLGAIAVILWNTKNRKTAHACLLPGREKNLGNAAVSNASLDAFFSSFICNVPLCVAGLK